LWCWRQTENACLDQCVIRSADQDLRGIVGVLDGIDIVIVRDDLERESAKEAMQAIKRGTYLVRALAPVQVIDIQTLIAAASENLVAT
jgi:hypothetical protein